MTTYVDTSAIYAILDADDEFHGPAREAWVELLTVEAPLLCSNYIELESLALIQNRLGLAGVRCFVDELLPVIGSEWIDATEHRAAVQAVLAADRRGLSLIDCTSFGLMRRLGLRRVFAFDRHFAEQGFELLPGS